MVRRRGVARRSAPRRRTYRTRVKWDPKVIVHRFKLLLPMMTSELDWELDVLMALEENVYPYLEAQGVPQVLWEYYMAFARRIWERRVKFSRRTFQAEKASVLYEFTLRGLNPTHLAVVQRYAELRARDKERGYIEPHPYACWYNICEDCAEWTVPAGWTCGVSSDRMEGEGSIEFFRGVAPGVWQYCTKPVGSGLPDGCWYFGFWFKTLWSPPLPNCWISARFRVTSTLWHGVTLINYAAAPNYYRVYHEVYDPGANIWGPIPYPNNAWNWFELYQDNLDGLANYYVRLNGGAVHTYAGLNNIGDPVEFCLACHPATIIGTVRVDYIRRAPGYEYPPT